jgi:hypothetical protein
VGQAVTLACVDPYLHLLIGFLLCHPIQLAQFSHTVFYVCRPLSLVANPDGPTYSRE